MSEQGKQTGATNLDQVVTGLREGGRELTVLLLGDEADLPDGLEPDAVVSLDGHSEPGESPERYALAYVASERISTLSGTGSALPCLAALRDRHARIVIVADERECLALTDYLALGFERLEVPGVDRAFIFDPDSATRRREWNNSRDWANPENFDKYRW